MNSNFLRGIFALTFLFTLAQNDAYGWNPGRDLRNFGRRVNRAAIDVTKTVEKGAQDLGNTAEKAAHDIGHTAEKAVQDAAAETKRAGYNVNDLVLAGGYFVEDQVHATGKTVADAGQRVRDGKIIDAVWHLTVDPLRHTENNLASAVQKC